MSLSAPRLGHRYGRIVRLELGTRRLRSELGERSLSGLVSGLDAELGGKAVGLMTPR